MSVTPVPWLLVVVTLPKPDVAAKVPFDKFRAWPVPLKVISGVVLLPTVSVPKAVPKIFAPVVLPMVKPRNVLFEASGIAGVAGRLVVIVGLAPPVPGNGSLWVGTVAPEIFARVSV